MPNLFGFGVAAVLAAGLLGASVASSAADYAQPATAAAVKAGPSAVSSEALFAASFKDFDRKIQPLVQYKGQPLLIYFWATWCASCKQEVPELKALHEKYKERNLRVIGISADNTDKVHDFARAQGIDYTLLLGSDDAIELSKKLGNKVGGLPFTVVVDAQGKIVDTVLGAAAPGRFEELIRPLL